MDERIQAGLEAQLFAVVSEDTVATENSDFTPPEMKPWFQATILPAAPQGISLGANGRERHSGFYQVNIFVPRNQGYTIAQSLAGTIKGAFSKGSSIESDGLRIVIERTYPGNSRQEPDWHMLPVLIEWRVDI